MLLLLQDLDGRVLPLLWHLHLRPNSDQDVVKVLPYGGVLAHAGSSCPTANSYHTVAILLAIFAAGIQLLHFYLILFFSSSFLFGFLCLRMKPVTTDLVSLNLDVPDN